MKVFGCFALVLFSLIGSAYATELKLDCGTIRISLDTDPYDPENAAGTLVSRNRPSADLYESPEVRVANADTYLIQNWGDGDTDFFYLALNDQDLNGSGNSVRAMILEKSDQSGKRVDQKMVCRKFAQ
jgi:hypothetical protein